VFDCRSNLVLTTVQLGGTPAALDWNPGHRRVYVSEPTNSCIRVIHDTTTSAFEQGGYPPASRSYSLATVVRGMLALPRGMTELSDDTDRVPRPALMDISGRKLLDLHPGANDVRDVAPGVYFVRSDSAATLTKVVVTR